MKNTIKVFGLTAIVAVIVFATVSCATAAPRVRGPISGIVSVIPGGTLDLRASGKEVTLSVSSTEDGTGAVASGTTVSNTGKLTVDPEETAQNLYVTATAEDGTTHTLLIRVVTVTEVVITPATATVEAGQYGSFSAQVNGANNPNQNVTWRVGSSADGTGTVRPLTLIVGGALTVNSEERGYLYVRATSVVDPTKSAIVRVTITPPPPKPEASQPAAAAPAASQAAAAPAASQPAAAAPAASQAAAAPAASQPAASAAAAPAASQPAAQQQPAQQQPAQNPQPLVGTWRSAGFNVTAYKFNADGTGTYSLGPTNMNLTWTVSGDRLTVNTNMGNAGIVTNNFTYNIIGNILTLQSTAGGPPIPMTRQ